MANNTLAYGFTDYASLANQRVAQVGAQQMYDAVEASARYHSDQLASVMDRLCRRTTDFKWRYLLPSGGTAQPLDEHGKPKVIKGNTYFDVALPMFGWGTGLGMTWLAAEKITVQELNAKTLSCLSQDSDAFVRRVLAALFTNTSYTYTDPEKGSLTVQCLANADVTYPIVGGATEASQHYLADSNALADAHNHYTTIYNQLIKHPSNNIGDTDIVCYIASNLVTTTEALSDFVPVSDPDVQTGANSDRITASAARITQVQGPGNKVLGKVGKVWVVEWKRMPDGYIIGMSMAASGNIVGWREEPEQSLQGLITKRDGDSFTSETYFVRRAGFGVINRIGAAVMLVGSSSYAIPTGYTAPLAV